MPPLVVLGAKTMCTMGLSPGSLIVLPVNMVNGDNKPAANIMDFKPIVNVTPFGMCKTPSNPAVAAATSAAMGVLTPVPCVPVTTSPWTPGASKTKIKNMPALHSGCTCMCTWGGTISITDPGQTKIQVT